MRESLATLGRWLSDWLLGQYCFGCELPCQAPFALCATCKSALPWIKGVRCGCCYVGLKDDKSSFCAQCMHKQCFFDRLNILFYYHRPISTFVQQLKFKEQLAFASILGHLLAEVMIERGTDVEAIIAVPLHHTRLRERGFNQALEIARMVASCLNLPLLTDACMRYRSTANQKKLIKSPRLGNCQQAFWVYPGFDVQRVAIIDDTFATGNTVNILSQALKAAGAVYVEIWCPAHGVLMGNF